MNDFKRNEDNDVKIAAANINKDAVLKAAYIAGACAILGPTIAVCIGAYVGSKAVTKLTQNQVVQYNNSVTQVSHVLGAAIKKEEKPDTTITCEPEDNSLTLSYSGEATNYKTGEWHWEDDIPEAVKSLNNAVITTVRAIQNNQLPFRLAVTGYADGSSGSIDRKLYDGSYEYCNISDVNGATSSNSEQRHITLENNTSIQRDDGLTNLALGCARASEFKRVMIDKVGPLNAEIFTIEDKNSTTGAARAVKIKITIPNSNGLLTCPS